MTDSETETATDLAIVYILTNPSMPGLVKIGRTSDLASRVAGLSSGTSVPEPFEVAYAAYVEDAAFVERALHAAFSMHRLPGREFFRIPVSNAVAALSLAEVRQVQLVSSADDEAVQIIQEVRERGERRGRKPDSNILDFVYSFLQEHGRSPSGSEIKMQFPALPTSTAYDYAKRRA